MSEGRDSLKDIVIGDRREGDTKGQGEPKPEPTRWQKPAPPPTPNPQDDKKSPDGDRALAMGNRVN